MVPRQSRAAFSVPRRPRNLAATCLLVQNSSTPNEDSVVLKVRSRDDSYKPASSQTNSTSTKPKNPFTEVRFVSRFKSKPLVSSSWPPQFNCLLLLRFLIHVNLARQSMKITCMHRVLEIICSVLCLQCFSDAARGRRR